MEEAKPEDEECPDADVELRLQRHIGVERKHRQNERRAKRKENKGSGEQETQASGQHTRAFGVPPGETRREVTSAVKRADDAANAR